MRRLRRVVVVTGLVAVALFGPAGAASAHPLGNFTINLYSGLVVEPGQLRVNYVLDMAEIPTYQERGAIDRNGDGTITAAERSAYATRKAAALVRGVTATVGGRPVRLHVVSSSMWFRPGQAGLPILRLQAVFAGTIPSTGTLEYREGNYAGHIGWREITAVGAKGSVVRRSSVPRASVSDDLLHYPTALLSSPLDVTAGTVSFQPGASGAAPTLPSGDGSGARPGITGGAFARLATWSHVSFPVLLVALLLAMAFGAGHALLPGHGKTIMAAYLVGAGGRARQAVQVGVAVAFMHTASVLALGIVVSVLLHFAPEQVYPWLTLGTGILVLALGAAMFASRYRARLASGRMAYLPVDAPRQLTLVGARSESAETVVGLGARGGPAEAVVGLGAWAAEDGPTSGRLYGGLSSIGHSHDGHSHEHSHHGHTHELPDPDRPLSRKSLAGLAVAGGILPSPTALVVLVSTIGVQHRVGFGLALIVAFSVGLAAALVGVGLLALRMREFTFRRLTGRFTRLIPLVSAAVVIGVGVFLSVKGAIKL